MITKKISFKQVQNMVKNQLMHQRAILYCNDQHIKDYQEEIVYNNLVEEEISVFSGLVLGSNGNEYKTLVSYDSKGNYFDCECTCMYYETNGLICKHILALNKYAEKKRLYKEVDDFLQRSKMNSLLTKYRNLSDEINTSVTDIQFIPYLITDGQDFEVKFRIGADKLYVVKNLDSFVSLFKQKEEYKYGEKLIVTHDENYFREEDLELLRYVINITTMEKENRSYDTTNNYVNKDVLKFKGAVADKLFELYLDRGMASANFDELIHFKESNPEVSVTMTRNRGNKYIVDGDIKRARFISGFSGEYLFYKNTIYSASKGFEKYVFPLIKELSQKLELQFEKDDMAEIFSNVLPYIKEYMTVNYDEGKFEEFLPKDADFKLYLDVENGLITGNLNCHYGETEVDIFDNKYEVGRNIKKEKSLKKVINNYFYRAETNFVIDDEEKQYDFLTYGVKDLDKHCQIFASEAFQKYKVEKPPLVSTGLRINGNLLELSVDFGNEFSDDEILKIINAYKLKKKFIKVSGDKFIDLAESAFKEIIDIADNNGLDIKELVENEKVSMPKFRSLVLNEQFEDSGLVVNKMESFDRLIKSMKNYDKNAIEPPLELASILRSYQVSGFRWLKTLAEFGFGGILADDMGLGKSLQSISFIASLKSEKPALIVCPSSLILNWKNEFKKFAKDIKVLTIYGVKKDRFDKINSICDYDVAVTSYELLRQDIEDYEKISFSVMFIDEGQYIKNHTTKNSYAVKRINSESRFALTGTPIENTVAELWSIFDFVMPNYLYSYSKFKNTFEKGIIKDGDPILIEKLYKMTRPFILRRLKSEVLEELPPKTDNLITVPLENEQRSLYASNIAIIRDNIKGLSEDGKSKIQILAYLTKLRQICCDPHLIFDGYEGNSAKMDAVMELITSSVESGHKVLLFSQFTSMLALIKTKLEEQGVSYYLLQGDTKKEDRMRMVDDFNNDETEVFLLSLKAGGTGLNLTGADIVIHYDPWWNISVQNQATDRTHRIGQKKSVQVYRLVVEDTVEEKILSLQEKKRALFEDIVRGGEFDISSMSKDDIMDLL